MAKKIVATIKYSFSIAVLITLLFACTPKESSTSFATEMEDRNPWNHLNFKNESEIFRFAVVSDRTAIPTPGVFAGAITKINLLQPDFVMSVGDLVEGFTFDGRISNLEQIDSDWNYVTNLVQQLEMPFFYTVGNNDINSPEAYPLWEKRFGNRTYYHFIYKDVLFLILNTDDPPGSKDGEISPTQLNWLNNTLKNNEEVKWTFIFMHRPMWGENANTQNWAAIELLFPNPSRTTVFAGHVTAYKKEKRNHISYYTLSKTGSFSTGNRPPGDDFDHIMWVTMTEYEPIIANILLEGIWGDDPRVSKDSIK